MNETEFEANQTTVEKNADAPDRMNKIQKLINQLVELGVCFAEESIKAIDASGLNESDQYSAVKIAQTLSTARIEELKK